ncbi:hypothetical protein Q0M83_14610, partial [Staphylococcus aureus]|nr:hypothetical protein [Staphylococcus aureus]
TDGDLHKRKRDLKGHDTSDHPGQRDHEGHYQYGEEDFHAFPVCDVFYDLRKTLCLNSHFFRISQKLTQCAEKIKTGSHCHPFSES